MKFDKYAVYTTAVQSPEYDAKFLRSVYRDLVGRDPKVLREDFCGAHALARAWVRMDSSLQAAGIDIDSESLEYGEHRSEEELTEAERNRLRAVQGDVLTSRLVKADVVCAFNFSYFCFKSRPTLVQYFSRVRRSLRSQGLFVVDAFGGPDCMEASVDVRRSAGLRYYFEQDGFDPITNQAKFHIHFHLRGDRKRKRVFSYDWRMWSIPEIRDAMIDAGFKNTAVYWEGTARSGRGSGRYHRREKGESCRVWTAYIVAF
ncbi:MAG: class I SAM-dependent methyltransferase [Pseudomonadota bacterium]|jgi:SAM-dependent methyltransferase